jgi:hypothetical protein
VAHEETLEIEEDIGGYELGRQGKKDSRRVVEASMSDK